MSSIRSITTRITVLHYSSNPSVLFYFYITDKIQNNVIVLYWPPCRSSPSPVYAMKPSSVQQLTTFCSTECCSRCTPSNCSPPTASSTTSVSFSPPPDEHSAANAPLWMPAFFLTGAKHNVNVYGNIFRGIQHLMWFACTDLLPENCVEEKTKSIDPNAVMAEIKHRNRQGVQLK